MAEVTLSFLEAGSCTHPGFTVIEGGPLGPMRFGATVAVIEHPRHGVLLFDTGYSARFHEATRHFPERLYALVTPVTIAPEQTAVRQLQASGIAAADVRHVVLSHFHADHAGGAADFPKARYLYQGAAWSAVRDLGAFGSVRAGFLRALLPGDFEARSEPLGPASALGERAIGDYRFGWDLFGDGTLVLVDLPGHVRGHSGLFVRAKDAVYFLVADACWVSRGYRERKLPHPISSLIMDSRAQFRATQDGIHQLSVTDRTVRIVPCHCAEAWTSLPHRSERAEPRPT